MTIGNNIKLRRKELGWTLQDLADECQLSKSYIWEIEKNKSTPSCNKFRDICLALGSTMEYMFDDDDVIDTDLVFFEKFKACRPETKEILLKILNALED